MSREQLVILLAATLVVGFVLGRVVTKAGMATALDEGPPAATTVAEHSVAPSGPAPTKASETAPKPVASKAAGQAAEAARPAASPAKAAVKPQPTPQPPKAAASPKAKTPATTPATPSSAKPDKIWEVAIAGDEPTLGPDSAPVKVVLFSAFGCQPCQAFAPAVTRLVKEYGDQVQVVFKQKTFDAPHPDSFLAAEISLAAHAQGKFWELHDKLMAMGLGLSRTKIMNAAKELGLNTKKIERALEAGTYRGKVLRDALQAYQAGAHSFPNVLANGARMPKPKNWDSLKALVDRQIPRAKEMLESGTSPKDLYAKLVKGGKNFPQLGEPGPALKAGASASYGKGAIELVVFEDFQCPFCAKSAPNFKEFADRFPGKIRLIFKHYPLSNIHAEAAMTAEAAIEAQVQGKFWEFHDKVFENQSALTRPDLERYAQEVGMDVAKLQQALADGTHKARLRQEMNEGRRLQVTGTPTVFLNGRKYQGPRGYPPLGLEAVAREFLNLK